MSTRIQGHARFLLVLVLLISSLLKAAPPIHAQGGEIIPRGSPYVEPSTALGRIGLPPEYGSGPNYVPGQLLVAFRGGFWGHSHGSVLAAHGLSMLRYEEHLGANVVSVPEGQEVYLAQELLSDPSVAYAEPVYLYHVSFIPNDFYYASDQWNLPHIGMPDAWDISTGSISVTVAVLDSGIELGHPDAPTNLTAGYDFINGDADPSDDFGHGTLVTGIIAANTNNTTGMAGIAWNTSIMPIKVVGTGGLGTSTQVANGIHYAVDNGAGIINMSLGSPDYSQVVADAVDYAYANNVAIVASAGNDYQSGNAPSYPGALDHVLAVAATGDLDEHAFYSNTGLYVDIAAPGGNPTSGADTNPNHWILSTFLTTSGYGDYLQTIGTSMAAPQVAAVLALIKDQYPALTVDELYDRICSTAVELGDPGRDDVFGWGRVDAYAALQADTSTPTPTFTPTETSTATPSPTETSTTTPSPTGTSTTTPSYTDTPTVTPSPTETPTITPSPTEISTTTPSPTETPTTTPSPTGTSTTTPSYTDTPTVTPSPTETSTASPTPTETATLTPTKRPFAASTPTSTPTKTATPTSTSAMPERTRPIAPTPDVPTATASPTTTATLAPTPTLLAGGTEPDAYEPDGTLQNASTLPLGTSQIGHSIHTSSDQDWIRFTLAAGTKVTLETFGPVGATDDTLMYLYPAGSPIAITIDNDGGQSRFSRITTFLGAGEYYVLIEENGNDATIASYDLHLHGSYNTIWIGCILNAKEGM